MGGTSNGDLRRAYWRGDVRVPESRRKGRDRRSWILLGIGLGSTVVVALIGIIFSGAAAVLGAVGLTIVAGVFQVLSVIVAGGNEPDADFVRTHIIQGQFLVDGLEDVRLQVEKAYETGNAEERRLMLGRVSAAFIQLEQSAQVGLAGWAMVRPELLDNGNAGNS